MASSAVPLLTKAQLARITELLRDPDALASTLPEDERSRYREAQESVVRARHDAGREGRKVWL